MSPNRAEIQPALTQGPDAVRGPSQPVLEVRNLKKHFPVRRGVLGRTVAHVRAVDGVSLTLATGETLGVVGESGCGKSTLGRMILKLIDPSAGHILLAGTDITHFGRRSMRPYRRQIQIIFQDPYSSLNPRMTAGRIVSEPMSIHKLARGREREERVISLFERVGLQAEHIHKYPHEFSGGQRQRIGIARALALEPQCIVADEPVSALDVSIQAQVINLLIDLQAERGVSYLFIAHDLAVVQRISHRIVVMYLGRIVEQTTTAELFRNPQHPYTEALLDAVPIPDPQLRGRKRKVLSGDVPSSIDPPTGCAFHPRCPYAEARCRKETPTLRETRPGCWVACHLR